MHNFDDVVVEYINYSGFTANSLNDICMIIERCLTCKNEKVIFNAINYCNKYNINSIEQLKETIERNVENEKSTSK